MIVIADSGSTKTDWIILDETTQLERHTMGFNPNFHTTQLIIQTLEADWQKETFQEQADEVCWYGSGCWDERRKNIIRRALEKIFPKAEIVVHHDLLGAARSTCGREPGISCIIGTGSNSSLYDGHDVIDNVTNLGYLIGDEGSGTHLGKALIRAYFYREMPQDIREKFEAAYPGGKITILDEVYGEGTPNVYLASFTRFLGDNLHHTFIQRLLYESFAEFIDRNVRKYPNHLNLPIHFIGSVAYHFQDSIKLVLEERNMKPGIFIQKPIDNLVKFHKTL